MTSSGFFKNSDYWDFPGGPVVIDMGREEGRVRCMERVTWKLALPYVKQIANGNLLYGSGNSNRGAVLT